MAIENEIGLARRGRGVGLLHGREHGAEQPNLPTLHPWYTLVIKQVTL